MIEEISGEIEINYQEINEGEQEIEKLNQKLIDLLNEVDITIENTTIEDETILEQIRSKLDSSIQTLEERIAKFEKQELQQEFNLKPTLDSALSNLLEELKKRLPDPGILGSNFEDWWKKQGLTWANQLRNGVTKLMIDSSNLGHDWQFSDQQMTVLKEYYDGNKLLVDCLSSDCYITRSVRDEIEATLVLPISEIEQRRYPEKV